MQEEVENRTVNLAISTTKLTARSLLNAFRAYMNHRRNVKAKKAYNMDTHIVGEQTIGQLLGQNQGATNIEIEKTEISGFKRILNKYGVDYAITKDKSQVPPRYLVFFKARDSDALTAAFKEFSAETARKAERPSMLALLAKMKVLAASLPKKFTRRSRSVSYESAESKTAGNSFYPICCLGPGRYKSGRSMAYRKREYSSLPHSRPNGGASCRVY